MSPAIVAALFFTVALLVTTAYFILGSIPLLVLEHDTPLDARFVRGFFNIYYVGAFTTAAATSLCYVLAGRLAVAAVAAGLAAVAVMLRRLVIPKMRALEAQIPSDGTKAIAEFRKLHLAAIGINIVQLAVVVWSLIALGR